MSAMGWQRSGECLRSVLVPKEGSGGKRTRQSPNRKRDSGLASRDRAMTDRTKVSVRRNMYKVP